MSALGAPHFVVWSESWKSKSFFRRMWGMLWKGNRFNRARMELVLHKMFPPNTQRKAVTWFRSKCSMKIASHRPPPPPDIIVIDMFGDRIAHQPPILHNNEISSLKWIYRTVANMFFIIRSIICDEWYSFIPAPIWYWLSSHLWRYNGNRPVEMNRLVLYCLGKWWTMCCYWTGKSDPVLKLFLTNSK